VLLVFSIEYEGMYHDSVQNRVKKNYAGTHIICKFQDWIPRLAWMLEQCTSLMSHD
jgi:hypothetical protein